jgi:hypothetical protein
MGPRSVASDRPCDFEVEAMYSIRRVASKMKTSK